MHVSMPWAGNCKLATINWSNSQKACISGLSTLAAGHRMYALRYAYFNDWKPTSCAHAHTISTLLYRFPHYIHMALYLFASVVYGICNVFTSFHRCADFRSVFPLLCCFLCTCVCSICVTGDGWQIVEGEAMRVVEAKKAQPELAAVQLSWQWCRSQEKGEHAVAEIEEFFLFPVWNMMWFKL